MACSSLRTDNGPHAITCAANNASTRAIASASVTSAVRYSIARTNISLINPASNRAPIAGSRSANTTPRWA
jgi:hypothetical protein